MTRAERLLREAPEAFKAAMQGFHQDCDLLCKEEGIELPEHCLDFVDEEEYAGLLSYLDQVTGRESICNADLRGLMGRNGGARMGAKHARNFIDGMRNVLRERLDAHG